MAAALLRRTSISHNALPFKFATSWCLSKALTQHFTIDKAVNENTIRRVSKGFSFYSQLAGGGGLPSFMRGAVFWESGKPLSIKEFHIPRPKAGEVLVRTKG
ncbi:uncharacterized protein LOC129309009 [Prosopis cineraria]|uniref:uncharacterized protein LOC129309009 n=1 Tax=Prosopis cineraria TaxID=364024 RepID=UPI00240EBA35|nr:uncharacterized protein LOC129309009 [Prosopis cineraria]